MYTTQHNAPFVANFEDASGRLTDTYHCCAFEPDLQGFSNVVKTCYSQLLSDSGPWRAFFNFDQFSELCMAGLRCHMHRTNNTIYRQMGLASSTPGALRDVAEKLFIPRFIRDAAREVTRSMTEGQFILVPYLSLDAPGASSVSGIGFRPASASHIMQVMVAMSVDLVHPEVEDLNHSPLILALPQHLVVMRGIELPKYRVESMAILRTLRPHCRFRINGGTVSQRRVHDHAVVVGSQEVQPRNVDLNFGWRQLPREQFLSSAGAMSSLEVLNALAPDIEQPEATVVTVQSIAPLAGIAGEFASALSRSLLEFLVGLTQVNFQRQDALIVGRHFLRVPTLCYSLGISPMAPVPLVRFPTLEAIAHTPPRNNKQVSAPGKSKRKGKKTPGTDEAKETTPSTPSQNE